MPSSQIRTSGSGYLLAVRGLREVDLALEGAEERILQAASRAINTTAARMRTRGARLTNAQIKFGMQYLTRAQNGQPPRLYVSRKANPTSLEATITGRDRPTSLARFVKGFRTKKRGKKGVRLEVTPGNTTEMKEAFLLDLKNGNTGLALRLKPGEKVRNKHVMVQAYSTRTQNRRRPSDRNLYLLYGPSVDQVFRDVSVDLVPEASDFLEREITRLLERNVV